jgi:hypothetical protein
LKSIAAFLLRPSKSSFVFLYSVAAFLWRSSRASFFFFRSAAKFAAFFICYIIDLPSTPMDNRGCQRMRNAERTFLVAFAYSEQGALDSKYCTKANKVDPHG